MGVREGGCWAEESQVAIGFLEILVQTNLDHLLEGGPLVTAL